MRITQSLRDILHLFTGPVFLKRDPAKNEKRASVAYSRPVGKLSHLKSLIPALGHADTKSYAIFPTNDINSEPLNKTYETIELPPPASDVDAQYQRYVKRWLEYCQEEGHDYERILLIAPDARGRSLSRLLAEGRYRELYLYKDTLPYGNEM